MSKRVGRYSKPINNLVIDLTNKDSSSDDEEL